MHLSTCLSLCHSSLSIRELDSSFLAQCIIHSDAAYQSHSLLGLLHRLQAAGSSSFYQTVSKWIFSMLAVWFGLEQVPDNDPACLP